MGVIAFRVHVVVEAVATFGLEERVLDGVCYCVLLAVISLALRGVQAPPPIPLPLTTPLRCEIRGEGLVIMLDMDERNGDCTARLGVFVFLLAKILLFTCTSLLVF